jgi:hypothetical protein
MEDKVEGNCKRKKRAERGGVGEKRGMVTE